MQIAEDDELVLLLRIRRQDVDVPVEERRLAREFAERLLAFELARARLALRSIVDFTS